MMVTVAVASGTETVNDVTDTKCGTFKSVAHFVSVTRAKRGPNRPCSTFKCLECGLGQPDVSHGGHGLCVTCNSRRRRREKIAQRPPIVIACACCGQGFIPKRRSNALYCSDRCRRRVHRVAPGAAS
jgi:hypothetical protein